MKNRFKFISFSLWIILILALSLGCTPTNDPVEDDAREDVLDKEIFMGLGFLDEKYIKDNQQFIIIKTDENNLELQVIDNDLFDNLESNEYYMVSYNENDVVIAISRNDFIKDLVLQSSGEDSQHEETTIISKSEKFDTDNLTLIDGLIVDINNNGEDETISMYTRAEKDSNGEIMWDDGQDWIILVEGKDNDYILFNEYVQLGTIQLFVYTIEDDFYITTVHSGTANLKITEYKFNSETEEFEASVPFTTRGNVSMIHSTK